MLMKLGRDWCRAVKINNTDGHESSKRFGHIEISAVDVHALHAAVIVPGHCFAEIYFEADHPC
jgi:hypothetical protein